jgi:hypothetical protein
VAKAFGVPIDTDPRALAILHEWVKTTGAEMNEAPAHDPHPQARGSHPVGGGGSNTCAVRAHDAQKLARAKRAVGAASAASKRVIDATSIRAEPSCVFARPQVKRESSLCPLRSRESGRAFKRIICNDISEIAVGTLITERPPRRTERAPFGHSAPTSGS